MIPAIRKDIEIHPFDTSSIPQKYLLITHDKKQFEISKDIYCLIELMDGKRNLHEIAEQFSLVTQRELNTQEIDQIISHYLGKNNLLLYDRYESKKRKSILYFKIPLFSNTKISVITKYLQYLFNKQILMFNFLAITIFLIYYFIFFNSPQITLVSFSFLDLIAIYLFLFLTTFFHEIGHASACQYLGAKNGDIGIGLYLYFPVLYTDVTDAWRLKRWQRAIIDIGGVYFQILTIPILFLLFTSTNNIIFVKLIYSLLFSVLSTLNPFFRFDGYWLVSDITGIPNLRERATRIIIQIFNRVIKKRNKLKLDYLDIGYKSKIFLYSYATISNLFFILFILFLLQSFPELIKNYPTLLERFFISISVNFEFSDLFTSISSLFFPSLIMIITIRIVFKLARKIYTIIFK